MVVPIILYGSSFLRKQSAEISERDNLPGIRDMLFNTLKNSKGTGLAAPQIKLLKRVFVMDTSPLSDEDITYREGCLSIPDIFEEVR